MKIKLVVFDIAGTTLQDDDAVGNCLRDALRAGGCDVSRDDVNAVMGMAKPRAIQLLLDQHRTAQSTPNIGEVQALHQQFLANMIAFYKQDPAIREIAGATHEFCRLRQAGIKIALDTGFSRDIVSVILQRTGWQAAGWVDAVVTSDEVAHGRPAPDMIFRAMELTGVEEARQVAKVGDTPADLIEGASANCGLVIGVTYGTHTRQQLEAYPYARMAATLTEAVDWVLDPVVQDGV